MLYMGSHANSVSQELFESNKYEKLKVVFLSLVFFAIIAGYTLAKELKDSIFIAVVGKDFVPIAKLISLIVLVPAILFYSRLVDKVNRYQLLGYYSAFFGIVGLLFTFFIGHPTIGIANTNASAARLFGWLFYFFVEGYSPFVVSVFWAFANSVTSPEEGKRNYGFMVSVSKFGGALSAGCAWKLFEYSEGFKDTLSGVGLHQAVLGVSSLMLVTVPFILILLTRKIPSKYLHGYEAAYQLEKQQSAESKQENKRDGMFAGLYMLLQYPYVLGIFGMVFFYEIVTTIIGFLRLTIGHAHASDISGLSAFLFKTVFITHVVGTLISFFGTSALLTRLGERICLLLIPVLSGIMLLYFMLDGSPMALIHIYAALKAINYGFSWPVRESLYIPTVKDIKFKSKSWIDAFGSKIARAGGSTFNSFVALLGPSMFLPAHAFLFATVVGVWFLTAFFVGRRFEQAIENNEVIGA